MKCGRANDWMSLYLDGRLDVQRLGRLEYHLISCAACRSDLARLRQVQAALREQRQMEEPPGLTEHVMRRISAYRAERWAQAWRGAGARRALSLIAALVALVVWAQM